MRGSSDPSPPRATDGSQAIEAGKHRDTSRDHPTPHSPGDHASPTDATIDFTAAVVASTAKLAGRKLGEYRIIREVGRGGMGTVFEAVQEGLGRKVALKVMRGAAMMDAAAVRRFYREAEAIGRLHHSNIVGIYSVGEQDATHYYAMEYVEGVTLSRVIHNLRSGTVAAADPFDPEAYSQHALAGGMRQDDAEISASLPVDPPSRSRSESQRSLSVSRRFINNAVDMIADVADALHHAHAHGVIHRDIKPANLLLASPRKLMISDFGLAHQDAGNTLTREGDFLGTPLYMSPEQALAGRAPVDRRTDIYSLGVTLYELVTLQAPFEGDSTHALLRQVVTKEPPSFRKLHVRLPRDLETITFKALEKDPDRRYQTAKEFADDLRRFLSYQAIHAKPAGRVTRSIRWVRRNRLPLGLVATALFAAAVILGAVQWHWASAQQRRLDALLAEGMRCLDRATQADDDRDADEYFEQAKDSFTAAAGIGIRPLKANEGLLALYLKRCQRALDRSQFDVARGILIPLRELDGQRLHTHEIDDFRRRALGTGTWSVQTQPPGCGVSLTRLDENFQPAAVEDLGTTPLEPRDIEMGTYLMTISHPAYAEVRYPMVVSRNQIKDVVVAMLRADEIPPGMVYVPAGEFQFGDPQESGMTNVYLEGFFIDRTEVTGAEYEPFVAATEAAAPEIWAGSKTCPVPLRDVAVYNVSWFDAMEYARWAGKRLPNEQEWEKAARGVDGRRFPWGNRFERRRCNWRESGAALAHVGRWPHGASPFGCLDMAGNVWEWTSDRERPMMTSMVMRGGAAYDPPDDLVTFRRQGAPPGGSSFGALNLTGFRCAKSLVHSPAKDVLDTVDFNDDLQGAALLYASQKRFDRVELCAERMLKANPRSVRGNYWMAMCRERQGKKTEALAAWKLVCVQNPSAQHSRLAPTAKVAAAKLVAELEKSGEQVDNAFLDVADLSKNATLALVQKDYPGAEKALDAILGIDPDNAVAHEQLAQVYNATDRVEQAAAHNERRLDAYRVSISEDPGNPQLLNEVAWFLCERHTHLDEAIDFARRAAALEPDSAAILDTLADLLSQSGKVAEAIEYIRQSIELDPQEVRYRDQLEKFQQLLVDAP